MVIGTYTGYSRIYSERHSVIHFSSTRKVLIPIMYSTEPPAFNFYPSTANNPRLRSAETEITNITEVNLFPIIEYYQVEGYNGVLIFLQGVRQDAITHANVANSFEKVADQGTSNRNIAKLMAIGDTTKARVVQKVDSQTAVLAQKMRGMSENQQEDTLKFNKTSGNYFIDVVMWTGKVLENVIVAIFRAIFTAIGQVIQNIGGAVASGIRGVIHFFRNLFS